MTPLQRQVISVCVRPQTMAKIMERTGCTPRTVYNMVARGMLMNIGNQRGGLYGLTENTMIEDPIRTFDAPPAIEQASSVWHYARRLACNNGTAAI